jgi:hypothetical protein
MSHYVTLCQILPLDGLYHAGPEDPRLIIWPGKGLYIMFISKPWPVNPDGITPEDTACSGPWAQQPWLMPLITINTALAGTDAAGDGHQEASGAAAAAATPDTPLNPIEDPWLQTSIIRLQYKSSIHFAGRKGIRHHKLHKEKNWIPFIHRNELYFSQVRQLTQKCIISINCD